MSENTKLAHQIVTCLRVKERENVWIQSWDHTIDLASEVAFACRAIGAHPFINLTTENYWMRSLAETPKELLETLPSHQAAALEQTDIFIFMLGPRNLTDWNKIPLEKQELANVWYLGSNRYLDAWRKIAKKHCVRMLGIEYSLATEERAKALGLNYETWRQVMLAGCLSDQREITQRATQIVNILRHGRKINVQTPFGTRLSFRLVGRKPSMDDSIVTKEDAANGVVKFLPSGCVEVAADEDSANGTAVYDVAIPIRDSKRIEGLTLQFHDGTVVKYTAEAGIQTFEDYLKSGLGDIDKFAFFGLGLNPGLKPGFTQDDKVLGNVTIGIGGNEDKGGKNRTRTLSGGREPHWWATMSKVTVEIDGKTVLKDGAMLL